MTLFVFEGLSRSGKSTVCEALLERNPEWVFWRGENLMRKGPDDHWKNYQRRYHEGLHRLYELNPKNIIISDRAFSDTVYNPDPKFRTDMRRLVACYGDVYIVYFYPGHWGPSSGHQLDGKDILSERGTRDAPRLDELMERYNDLLSMFPNFHVNTDEFDVEESVKITENYIENTHGENEHSPDV